LVRLPPRQLRLGIASYSLRIDIQKHRIASYPLWNAVHKLRIASYTLWIAIQRLRAASYTLSIAIQTLRIAFHPLSMPIHKLRIASYSLWIAIQRLWIAYYKLSIAIHSLRAALDELSADLHGCTAVSFRAFEPGHRHRGRFDRIPPLAPHREAFTPFPPSLLMDPIARARLSLEGLSLGDAFGERFFGVDEHVASLIERRATPGARIWRYTDDTEMALSLVDELARAGTVDQDALATAFAHRMDPARGYGAGAYRVLLHIKDGGDWRRASRGNFRGTGSFGNGAAMRVAPLGAYFAHDLDRCVDQARLSAEITHAHAQGIAGAIAVAAAAALAWERHGSDLPLGREWLRRVRDVVPAGEVRDGIDVALGLPAGTSRRAAVRALGCGWDVTAADTVPFCLWVASWYSHDFVEAMWQTVSALGDRDTTCAIVGGIVSVQVGESGMPAEWRAARELLPMARTDR
jgi:ADP-ribosylglycohydrolase